MFSSNQQSKYSAFTLVEFLIVTFIIIILSIIIVADYELGGYQLSLRRASNKLAQDLRLAEEMAMASEKLEGSVPSGGYGIHFITDERLCYIIFADKNENGAYEEIIDSVVDLIYFENFVAIWDICVYEKVLDSYQWVCGDSQGLDIVFTPPGPTVKFNNDVDVLGGKVKIVSERTGGKISISVNNIGLIETKVEPEF